LCGFFGGLGDEVENLAAVAVVPLESGNVLSAEKGFSLVESRSGFEFADNSDGGRCSPSTGHRIAAKSFGVLDAFEVFNHGFACDLDGLDPGGTDAIASGVEIFVGGGVVAFGDGGFCGG
jgi:hypothetical protein